jgi:hypothetical protein
MEKPNKQNVQDTLREVIGETVSSSATATLDETTNSNAGTNAETKSGEPAKEYVSGIDISDVPEQDRPRFKEMFSKKAKLLEDGYQVKFKGVAALAKAQEDLEKMGLQVEEAREVLTKHLEAKKGKITDTDKAKSLRTLDRLIDNASDADQKAALTQMRTIVEEETGIKSINERLDRLDKFYQSSSLELSNKRQTQLNDEIKQLETQYGQEVVGKYKEDIMKHGMASNNTARRLLHAIADPDEIEQAILSRTKETKKKPISEDKLNAISSGGSGITGSHESLDTKKMSFKDIFRTVIPEAGKK